VEGVHRVHKAKVVKERCAKLSLSGPVCVLADESCGGMTVRVWICRCISVEVYSILCKV
jgi:hypothetical protein